MAESGQKMGDYTPLAAGEKEYFLGNGEAGVVAVGKTSAGTAKTNRLVKISEIAGDKLPDGGTEGQVLTKTSSGEAWANVPTELPSGGSTGQFLKKTTDGTSWDTVSSIDLTETTLGGITDTSSDNILDANNEIIGDSNSETFVSGINSKNILAKRTYEDEDGNNIKATYVKKEDILPPVIDGGTLTDAASITVDNNALSKLSTTQSALTLNVNLGAGEVANFAVEIDAGANVTLTVTSTTGSTVKTLYKSIAGGNSLESGKFYQVTCVGSCWTLASFEVPEL